MDKDFTTVKEDSGKGGDVGDNLTYYGVSRLELKTTYDGGELDPSLLPKEGLTTEGNGVDTTRVSDRPPRRMTGEVYAIVDKARVRREVSVPNRDEDKRGKAELDGRERGAPYLL